MSGWTAIGRVGESLQRLLEGKMKISGTEATLLSPDESGGGKRVNLFLYKVQENPLLKNMDWQVKRGAPHQLTPPPLSLNLFYLLTAYATTDNQAGDSTAHAILGDAMRVLHENSIIPQQYLDPDLQGGREQIKIMLAPMDMEELSRVWSTFGKPFRPSVMYEVSVVQIDVLEEPQPKPLARRVETIKPRVVTTVFVPPTLDRIEPVRGPAGTTITVIGAHLAGWKATVYLMGKPILATDDFAADTFQVTLPADLQPGLYELKVDIEQLFDRKLFEDEPQGEVDIGRLLCRRTFLFEVKAS